jgi:GR25 family glycosyltransferase involved in LPS biosynthesis
LNEIFVGILGLKSNFRGDELLRKIQALGIPPEIVWGIQVDEIGNDRLLNYASQEQARFIMGRNLTVQEISCALGHLEMYEVFLNSGKDFALFLEDDADFDDNIEEILGIEFPRDRPAILQLGGYLDPQLLPKPFPATFPNAGDVFRACRGILRCLQYPVYAHGYMMNKEAALLAVHLMRGRKINSPADFPFVWRSSIPFYITVKQIVWQRESVSNIQNNRSVLEIDLRVSGSLERRLQRLFALNPLFLLHGRRMGLSGNAIVREKVLNYLLSRYYSNVSKN